MRQVYSARSGPSDLVRMGMSSLCACHVGHQQHAADGVPRRSGYLLDVRPLRRIGVEAEVGAGK